VSIVTCFQASAVDFAPMRPLREKREPEPEYFEGLGGSQKFQLAYPGFSTKFRENSASTLTV
jgi:hypothetical protein